MASEMKRGCGYRKVGGMYLVGEYRSVPCDRLPYPLTVCAVCGQGIKVGRGMTEINPSHLFGEHTISTQKEVITGGYEQPTEIQEVKERCGCHAPCFMCDPQPEPAYIMAVGEKYYPTPQDFVNEGVVQGVSKRINQIPKNMNLGETVLYLAHPKACSVHVPAVHQQTMAFLDGKEQTSQTKLLEADKVEKAMGIFSAFIPHRIEKLYWQSELDSMPDEEKSRLAKRGITPVGIPDGDNDHI